MITCGTCQHGKMMVKDMTKRICKGGPPQIVVLPAQGGVSVQVMYPNVNASDEACGAYKAREIVGQTPAWRGAVPKDPIRGGDLS